MRSGNLSELVNLPAKDDLDFSLENFRSGTAGNAKYKCQRNILKNLSSTGSKKQTHTNLLRIVFKFGFSHVLHTDAQNDKRCKNSIVC